MIKMWLKWKVIKEGSYEPENSGKTLQGKWVFSWFGREKNVTNSNC